MMKVITVVVLLILMKPQAMVDAAVPAILEAPENRTVGLGQDPLTLTCRVRSDHVFIRIDGELFGHSTETKFRNRGITSSNGFHSNGEVTQRVTVALIVRNNNTNIICHAVTANQPSADSDPGFIFIAGPPLPPSLQYSVIDENSLRIFWAEPYSADEFPITSYFLRVVDVSKTMETVLVGAALSPDTHTYNITRLDATSNCTNLTFQIWAQNSVGNSSAGTTYGAFPARPGPLKDLISIVTFSQDLSPMLQINFTMPSLCPYNNATYMIEIEDADHEIVYTIGPRLQHWMDSGALISLQVEDVGLEINAEYTLNITMWNSIGQISRMNRTKEFDTALPTLMNPTSDTALPTLMNPTSDTALPTSTPSAADAALPVMNTSLSSTVTGSHHSLSTIAGLQSSKDSTRDVMKIVASTCAGTILLMVALAASIICVIYVYRCSMRRKRDCVHTTELANHVSRAMPMVVNPIYETGAIYEEIPASIYKSQPTPTEKEEGYVSISSSAANSSGKCFLEKGNEEMYTPMNPAGTLLGQLSVNPAGTLLGQLSVSTGDASMDSPVEATIYTNICDEEGASVLCGQHEHLQPVVTESEDRYVLVH